MASRLVSLSVDAQDPARLARFWSGMLGWKIEDDVPLLSPPDDGGFVIRFPLTTRAKTQRNHIHFDLTSSSLEDQAAKVARALELGARHIDVGQTAEDTQVVLADPEGNEFCVIAPGNGFLAGCPLIGALSCDGTQVVGYFWSAALGWPLVWDQDQETAIQSPEGGSKISWGGPPLNPWTGKHRLHLDVEAVGELGDEVDRLESLGAQRVDIGQGSVNWVVMADPDGHEFCVHPDVSERTP